jgi:hypothetical protein
LHKVRPIWSHCPPIALEMVKANFHLMSTFFLFDNAAFGFSFILHHNTHVLCIMYRVLCTYCVSRIMNCVSCIAYCVSRIMHCVSCIVYCVLCIVYRVFCIVYCVLCIVYCVSCIVYRVSCIVYRVLCIVYHGMYAVEKSRAVTFFSLDVAKNVANRTNCYVFNYVIFCNIHFIDLIGKNTSSRWLNILKSIDKHVHRGAGMYIQICTSTVGSTIQTTKKFPIRAQALKPSRNEYQY